MTYGTLVIEYALSKDEVRALERKLENSDRITFRGLSVLVTEVEVGAKGHNVQHVTVKGTA